MARHSLSECRQRLLHPHYVLNILVVFYYPLLRLLNAPGFDHEVSILRFTTFFCLLFLFKLSTSMTMEEGINIFALYGKVWNAGVMWWTGSNMAWIYLVVYGLVWIALFAFLPQPAYQGPHRIIDLDKVDPAHKQAWFRHMRIDHSTVSGPKIVELAPTEDNDKDKVDEGEAADADDASTFAAAENAQYWVALMKVDWSIACLNFEGVFAELSLAYTTPNLKFIKMDLDINPQLESQLSISTGATSLDLPTVILFEREKGELARLPPPATQDRSTDRPTMTDVTHNARETLQRLGWDRSPRSVIQAFALEKRYAETISSKKKR